ncbi:hypothetical protein [Bacillus sp. SJS]|uniref:hypothetical protein n=1 Tax=Bacillus sp. SJS TaxID=1423321 RepID=UPI0004DD8B03|nr:hypothetical protein [Bacillus sp. SJS]KZZ82683.1 hypothetical protein AS29_017895 [Bacillus sp. SJS]
MIGNQSVSIPKPPDSVTILWQRNPLDRRAPRTIVEASVIGSAKPCQRLLQNGMRYRDAAECLRSNGFEQITSERLGVFGLAVFVRES